jgi:D-glycero-D-manno-heptose 1,7-bisphosphate phosphatase
MVMSHQQWRAVVMCATDDFGSLHDSLKRAAAEKLGASLEDSMKEEDFVRFQSGARTMETALREAKERLAARKLEIGEEAALNELDDFIRAGGRAAASPTTLTVRPKLVLLDRDGCINEDVGAPGVLRATDLRLIPGAAGAMRQLRPACKVAIVTNQSARGKGLLSADELDKIHEELRHQLASRARGGLVGREQWDALYVCEDAGSSPRKEPEAGLLCEALRDFGVDPGEAVMIGDSWSDVVAARRAGCAGVLLATGHGASLGSILKKQGVQLPITLILDAEGDTATDYMRLQRSVVKASSGGATQAVEEWIQEQGEEQKALIWEALRKEVRVYSDLSQAVDELMALPTAPDMTNL